VNRAIRKGNGASKFCGAGIEKKRIRPQKEKRKKKKKKKRRRKSFATCIERELIPEDWKPKKGTMAYENTTNPGTQK